jgi:hypothetical protein
MAAQFEDFVRVVTNLSDRLLDDGTVTGSLAVADAAMLEALKACEEPENDTRLMLLEPVDASTIAIGSTVKVAIGTPRPGFALLSANLDTLLNYPTAHVKEPAHFYLLDSSYASPSSATPPDVVGRYRAVLAFVGMLRTCAAFLDTQEEMLVFVNDGKFEVPVKYTEADVRNVKIASIDALAKAIPDGMHAEQCASIMAEAVCELTAQLPSGKRFSFLLENADDLKERFDKGYKLFAAGFSYDKIKDEIEATQVEYAGKIHKAFSDIQNQLLGIPVATVVVATQMKESKAIDGNFWISLAVLVGSFVFMLLMHFLLRNQRHTLEVVGIEIKRQKGKLEKEHAAIAENFVATFAALDKRYNAQRLVLYAVDGIVVVGFLLSTFFFYTLNQPVQQWVGSFWR